MPTLHPSGGSCDCDGTTIQCQHQYGRRCLGNRAAIGHGDLTIWITDTPLAIEYAPHGITVNAIAPGFFHTNIMVASGYSEQESTERYKRLKRHIPLGRVGKPDDLRGTAVYLASAASDYMTGHILTVDGGWLTS